MLYLRVEDKEAGVIYCTTQLGRFITFVSPDIESMAGTKSTSCRIPPRRHFCIPTLMSMARCSNSRPTRPMMPGLTS